MTGPRFARLRDLVLASADVPVADRAAFLHRECGEDSGLRQEAESLLALDPHLLAEVVRTGGALTLLGLIEPLRTFGNAPSAPERVGPYRMLGILGRGGMGVVYRARDTRLGRDVALKLLPVGMLSEPERIERFRREAHVLAALSHPHIAHLYGVEDAGGGTYALVMELIEGISLASHLATGPMPVVDALTVARDVAAALDKAHEGGIVHRDLKPANVMITPDGAAKLLDFGVAKAFSVLLPAIGGAASSPASGDGGQGTSGHMLVGTVAYMSPEQARGESVDRGADIWAFGCILYEMLTGRSPFHADTFADTIVSLLTRDPAWDGLPITTPPAVRQLLRRCLRRDRRERVRDVADARFVIEDALAEWGRDVGASAASTRSPAGAARRLITPPVCVRPLTFYGRDNLPSASPGGRLVAFASDREGHTRIWIKDLATGGEQPLTAGEDTNPKISPDGGSVLFLRTEGGRQNVYRQAIVGGHARKCVDDALDASWFPDGAAIAFIRRSPDGTSLATCAIDGGHETDLYRTAAQLYGVRCAADGQRIIAVESPPTGKSEGYALVMIERTPEGTRSSRRAVPGPPISAPVWNGSGNAVLFAQAGSTLGDHGDPIARVLLHDLGTGGGRTLFYAEGLFPTLGRWSLGRGTAFDITGRGSLVFGSNHVKQTLRDVTLGGGDMRDVVSPGECRDRQPTFSPDGTRLVFSSNRSGHLGLWTFDLVRQELRPLTDDRARHWDPSFTADGRHIMWSSDRSGHLEVWRAAADGSGARQVTSDGHDAQNPTATPDGSWIVYWSAHPEKTGIWRIRPDGSDAARLVDGAFAVTQVSPSGRWAGFVSQEPHNMRTVIGLVEIETGRRPARSIAVPWPPAKAEDVVIGRLRWTPDGRAIAFVAADEHGRFGITAQDVDADGEPVGTPRPIAGFDDRFATESFCFSPDGARVVISCMEKVQRLMLAEGVPGVEPQGRAVRR